MPTNRNAAHGATNLLHRGHYPLSGSTPASLPAHCELQERGKSHLFSPKKNTRISAGAKRVEDASDYALLPFTVMGLYVYLLAVDHPKVTSYKSRFTESSFSRPHNIKSLNILNL